MKGVSWRRQCPASTSLKCTPSHRQRRRRRRRHGYRSDVDEVLDEEGGGDEQDDDDDGDEDKDYHASNATNPSRQNVACSYLVIRTSIKGRARLFSLFLPPKSSCNDQ